MVDILEPPSLARWLGQVPVSFCNTDGEPWLLWVERELKTYGAHGAPDPPRTGHTYFQSGQQGPMYPVFSETPASTNTTLVSSGPHPLSAASGDQSAGGRCHSFVSLI